MAWMFSVLVFGILAACVDSQKFNGNGQGSEVLPIGTVYPTDNVKLSQKQVQQAEAGLGDPAFQIPLLSRVRTVLTQMRSRGESESQHDILQNQKIVHLLQDLKELEEIVPIPGKRGERGPAGPVGPTGVQGPRGATGVTGDIGDTGPVGAPGTKGERGRDGPVGQRGPKGDRGQMGLNGLDGHDGPKGDQGEMGDEGVRGPAGLDGPPGLKGSQGPRGPRGVAGQKGPIGLRGADGPPSHDGIDGIDGEMGPPGERGQDGTDGKPGPPGPRGRDGVNGVDGPKGDTLVVYRTKCKGNIDCIVHARVISGLVGGANYEYITESSGTTDACQDNPCGRHGKCLLQDGNAMCACHGGWSGTNCDYSPSASYKKAAKLFKESKKGVKRRIMVDPFTNACPVEAKGLLGKVCLKVTDLDKPMEPFFIPSDGIRDFSFAPGYRYGLVITELHKDTLVWKLNKIVTRIAVSIAEYHRSIDPAEAVTDAILPASYQPQIIPKLPVVGEQLRFKRTAYPPKQKQQKQQKNTNPLTPAQNRNQNNPNNPNNQNNQNKKNVDRVRELRSFLRERRKERRM